MTEAFVYDAWGRGSTSNEVVLDFTDGALTRRWLHGPGVDEPLAFYAISGAGGTGYDLQADRQGSILRVVDPATGTVVAEYEYQAFGLRNTTGLLSQRYAFTGREADDESGLLYYRARHYDPATGMFLQRDPIGFAAADLNLYAYVWNNPAKWTDPSGLAVTADGLGGFSRGAASGAAVGGLFGGIRGLAAAIAAAIVWNAANSDDDADDDSKDDPAPPPPPPECEPNDPNCEQCESEEFYGENDYLDTLEHFPDELLNVDFDWRKVIAEGKKYFDVDTGNYIYESGNNVVVTDSSGNPRTAYDGNSRSTTNRKVTDGRWRPCN